MKNLVDSDCTISSADREVLDLGFADYNPFCANNRDPGATGNDQCYGEEDINGHAGINPTVGFNTAASIKPGVMQALLSVFMSICSFFCLLKRFPSSSFYSSLLTLLDKFDKFLYRRGILNKVLAFLESGIIPWLLSLDFLSDQFL